ncbi:MAG: hypothetical protein NTV99_09705 [Deltaproteobacteria bacterium]|nr:hypothetical protein [Deltaproteobacteria bacterium]
MSKKTQRTLYYTLSFLTLILAFVVITWLAGGATLGVTGVGAAQEGFLSGKDHPEVRATMAVQDRNGRRLMTHPDIVGTATGHADDGRPAVLIMTKKRLGPAVIPSHLEGKPVVEKVTGPIFALAKPAAKIYPTKYFTRPVPIGVSTGNRGECSAGTIGARVVRGNNLYALSNNHVYALENEADIGSEILQPGLYDTKCVYRELNVIGTLADFVPIDFSADNVIDAAIASVTDAMVGNATPAGGYGTPKSETDTPSVGQKVQKYGRSSSLTKGTVLGTNATIKVIYGSRIAVFKSQIMVSGKSGFIKPGDSGSLLVTYPGRNPVGLLFAGNSSGSYAWANPIDEVLDAFNVEIDGE